MRVNDYSMRKISAATAIAGTTLLLLFSIIIEPKEATIQSISDATIGQTVSVKGIAKNPYFSKNTLLFDFFDPQKIRAVKFSPTQQELKLVNEAGFLQLNAKVQRYKGELELVVQSVKKLD